jgi:hypothetical protein
MHFSLVCVASFECYFLFVCSTLVKQLSVSSMLNIEFTWKCRVTMAAIVMRFVLRCKCNTRYTEYMHIGLRFCVASVCVFFFFTQARQLFSTIYAVVVKCWPNFVAVIFLGMLLSYFKIHTAYCMHVYGCTIILRLLLTFWMWNACILSYFLSHQL